MAAPRLLVLLPLFAWCLLAKYMAYLAGEDVRYASVLWGFTPLYALGLFSAASYRSRLWAFAAVPLVYCLGDALILASGAPLIDAFQPLPTALNYAAMFAIVGCGALIRRRPTELRIFGAGVSGAIVFYALTNFGAWWYDPQMVDPVGYSRDLPGLLYCYWLGIPFAYNTFGAMLVFSALFFSPLGQALLTLDGQSAFDVDHSLDNAVPVPVRAPSSHDAR